MGNPQEPDVYARIRPTRPMKRQGTGLSGEAGDRRLQRQPCPYWEAAKWVSRLRATKTDDNLLLLKTELGAGPGGMSGRYQGLRDVALEYSFIFKLLQLEV